MLVIINSLERILMATGTEHRRSTVMTVRRSAAMATPAAARSIEAISMSNITSTRGYVSAAHSTRESRAVITHKAGYTITEARTAATTASTV